MLKVFFSFLNSGIGVDLSVNGNPGKTVVIKIENISNNNGGGETMTIKAVEKAKI